MFCSAVASFAAEAPLPPALPLGRRLGVLGRCSGLIGPHHNTFDAWLARTRFMAPAGRWHLGRSCICLDRDSTLWLDDGRRRRRKGNWFRSTRRIPDALRTRPVLTALSLLRRARLMPSVQRRLNRSNVGLRFKAAGPAGWHACKGIVGASCRLTCVAVTVLRCRRTIALAATAPAARSTPPAATWAISAPVVGARHSVLLINYVIASVAIDGAFPVVACVFDERS